MIHHVHDEQGRPEPPRAGDEVANLRGFLDFQRATIAWKADGLDDDDLRLPMPVSALTFGGLLVHLAYVEDIYFTHVVGGQPLPSMWTSDEFTGDNHWDYHKQMTGSQIRNLWHSRIEASDKIVDAALAAPGGLDAMYTGRDGDEVSLRWVLTHMLQEYARHAGHADLMREMIDGEVGE